MRSGWCLLACSPVGGVVLRHVVRWCGVEPLRVHILGMCLQDVYA